MLFAYGTLLFPEVLQAVIGRRLPAVPATLGGFIRRRLVGEIFPAIVEAADEDRIDGLLYSGLEERDWRRLDRFEGELYERRSVTLRLATAPGSEPPRPGVEVHTYVLARAARQRLDDQPWDPEQFARDQLTAFVARLASAHDPRASLD